MAKRPRKTQAPPPIAPKPPLRLEWIEAGTLSANPDNWRRHPREQLDTLRELLDDPDVGWAGACLFNERTGRLIDGHARRDVVDPATPIPVLVGSWNEEAERRILLTLDPVAAMAGADRELYENLAQQVTVDGLYARELIWQTAQGSTYAEDDEGKPTTMDEAQVLPDMECQPFEHYDYVLLLFRNSQDWQRAQELLGLERIKIRYPGGFTKVGLGRCLEGPKAIAILLDAGRKGVT